MPDLPSPPAARLRSPRWLDGRLVVGVLLVLLSVVLGANVVARADRSVQVYALQAETDLAEGSVLTDQDLRLAKVRLFDGADQARYFLAAEPPTGRVLLRGLTPGELVPRAAAVPPDGLDPRRRVTIPAQRLHVPDGLAVGDLIDVFVTTGGDGEPRVTRLVLSAALTVRLPTGSGGALAGGGGAERAVVVEVEPELVQPVVEAVQGGAIDVVLVVDGRRRGQAVPVEAVSAAPSGIPMSPTPTGDEDITADAGGRSPSPVPSPERSRG